MALAAAGRGDGAPGPRGRRPGRPARSRAQGSWRRGRARPRRRRASGTPLGLAIRLQRGFLLGWGVGVLVIGIAYGSIGPTVDAFIGENKALAEIFAGSGGGTLTDPYFATSFRLMALLATGFAIQSALRSRSEETSMRAELVLATPVSRWRFAAATSPWRAQEASSCWPCRPGHRPHLRRGGRRHEERAAPARGGRRLRAGDVAHGRLAVALVGLAPRLVGVSWAILVACLVVGFLGVVLASPSGSSTCRRSSACPNYRLRA